MKKLSDIIEGESVIVEALNVDQDIRRRLLDIGLLPGMKITCELVSPFGDPKAYEIKGALIALRHEDTENIEVRSFNYAA